MDSLLYRLLQETITGLQGSQNRTPIYSAQADLESAQVAQARLRNAHPQLMLERRLPRSKDGIGFWWAELSSEISLVILTKLVNL
jgi:hypothetical protein